MWSDSETGYIAHLYFIFKEPNSRKRDNRIARSILSFLGSVDFDVQVVFHTPESKIIPPKSRALDDRAQKSGRPFFVLGFFDLLCPYCWIMEGLAEPRKLMDREI